MKLFQELKEKFLKIYCCKENDFTFTENFEKDV